MYSMATPTIAGAEEMLAYLGTKPIAEGSSQKVVLTDLREEAVVYINNTPFVLRELNKPVDTLKHIGITGPVVCSIPRVVHIIRLQIKSRTFPFPNLVVHYRWNRWRHV